MKSARSNKQNVVGTYRPVLGAYGAAFYQWKKITLYSLSGYISARRFSTLSNLIQFVDKNDTCLLDGGNSLTANVLFINQSGGFLVM